MDSIDAFRAINKSIMDVAKSLNVLEEVKEEKKQQYIRLEETTFVLTEETNRYCQVVSAHDLHQYKNRFHSISLKEKFECWIDVLLSIDKGEEYNVT